MVSFLLLFISRARDGLILLVFPHEYNCAFLIVWKSYRLEFPSYFNNRNASFVIKFEPFPEFSRPISCCVNSAKPLVDTSKRRMVSFLLLFISRARDGLILLVFPHEYNCAFLIVWKSYRLEFPSYFNNRNASFVIKFEPFPEFSRPISCCVNSAKPLVDTSIWAMYSPHLGFRKSISRAINSPLPLRN